LVKRLLLTITVTVFIVISGSRAVSLTRNYGAIVHIYTHLSTNELNTVDKYFPGVDPINICVGKEWYRFPSNFFLPSERFQLRFLKSGFTGQLPKPYAPVNGTWIMPHGFNDQNREEFDRYVCQILLFIIFTWEEF
jgi:alpha-1,2-mannosyltransferase